MPRRARNDEKKMLDQLRWPLRLTRLGMISESTLRAFWPLFSVAAVLLAALMLGIHAVLPVEVVWAGSVLGALALLISAGWGLWRFRWPRRAEALERLDATLAGRPIRALLDDQAIGANDPASAAVWQAHRDRMAARAARARPSRPDLRLANRDPFALRYVATLALVVAALFGGLRQLETISQIAPGATESGPVASWEGWIEPPRYTGRPALYLNDQQMDQIEIAQGSRITLRFYGPVGALALSETVSGRIGEVPPASDQAHEFTVNQSGDLTIEGDGGKGWRVAVIPDLPPNVSIAGQATAEPTGEMHLPYAANDDYGVASGTAHIDLDIASVPRRFGLAAEPGSRPAIEAPLPMPFTGDRRDFTETFIEDFSQHPWAHLPVTITLTVTDAAGNQTSTEPYATPLPARRFFDPLAAAVIEQRRDLMWARSNARRVAQVLRAVSNRPGDVFRSETAYLRLRVILRRLETMTEYGLKPAQQEEVAQALWDLAIILEEGDLGDALERMRRAQERLNQAMRDGASDQEIAELMQELRDATQDYMRQLSRQAQQDGQNQPQDGQPQGESMQMTQDDLQRMMDRIQELMEQGRMAEAQQALEEFQRMMENMRVTQGQGGQSEGQQAMEGLADSLRQQQGLSDQAFRDLQEQFNPGAGAGESQGNEGRNGGEGRGQSHEGQNGQGQGQGDQQGEEGGQGSLADRQQALREELRRQQGQLPGAGTEAGRAARDALDRAGRAMDGAEENLRNDDYAGAIDDQAEAMDALREGMQSLGEALAQQDRGQRGQGNDSGNLQSQNRDPLGRNTGSQGSLGTDDNLLQGEDVYRRARELLDEIRRRSGETERPKVERDYLRRLLDRF